MPPTTSINVIGQLTGTEELTYEILKLLAHLYYRDVLTVLDTDELDRCLAVWAASSYVLANLQDRLPR
ncbi:unnamed protein product [Allacma fusca]|uniref:Uncharacterized protein n=1 Tax=Allacma fusca TaxID=39272 RepID=A0A8J2KRM3_9HEXA|nr:unnamed protein product [Allacma fusca]